MAEKRLLALKQRAEEIRKKPPAKPDKDAGPLKEAPAVSELARRLATPSRALAVLPRPASTDAQPNEQQMWEQSFPDTLRDSPQAVMEATAGPPHVQQDDSDDDDDVLVGDVDFASCFNLGFLREFLYPSRWIA